MLRGAGDNFFRQRMSNTIFHRVSIADLQRRLLNRPQPAVYHLLHSLGQQCRDMVERVALLVSGGDCSKARTKTARPEEMCRVRRDNAERNGCKRP